MKNHPPKSRRTFSSRVNLRIQPEVKSLLVKAAALQRVKLTEFMVKSSQAAAEMAMAEQTRFVLSAEKWREFNAALDASDREIPALRKLFKEPSSFKPA